MEKQKQVLLTLEFLLITAIGVIPSQSLISKYWVIAPIVLVLALKFYEYKDSVAEKNLRVKSQLMLLIKLLPQAIPDLRCTYHV